MANTPLTTFRLTPDDLTALDSLGPNRSATIRRLIHEAAGTGGGHVVPREVPGQLSLVGSPPPADVVERVDQAVAAAAARQRHPATDNPPAGAGVSPCKHWRTTSRDGGTWCLDCRAPVTSAKVR
ncbi:MAG TPA: hypothetical protein VFK70_00970 [Vicinamibacteria bacterium]|nr:hypothetical protein [Vicinamibacteria bacterium]